jgi:hypothetical protein
MTTRTDTQTTEASPVERANRLLAEARAAAREHVREVERAIDAAAQLSAQIADGGDIYPPGVRETCRRLAEEAHMHSMTLGALSARLLDAPHQHR